MGGTHEMFEATNYHPPAENTNWFITAALKLIKAKATPML